MYIFYLPKYFILINICFFSFHFLSTCIYIVWYNIFYYLPVWLITVCFTLFTILKMQCFKDDWYMQAEILTKETNLEIWKK